MSSKKLKKLKILKKKFNFEEVNIESNLYLSKYAYKYRYIYIYLMSKDKRVYPK